MQHLDSAKEAVTLCITMMGVMAFWMGIMEMHPEQGSLKWHRKKCRPLIRFLFPDIPKEHQANQYITTNFIANFLGLGWAATPAGLQGSRRLAELEQERRMKRAPGKARKPGVASNEMCTFLIMNISSLQLIPINVIAYRSQYGSVNPAAIVGAGIVATTVSTLAGWCIVRSGWDEMSPVYSDPVRAYSSNSSSTRFINSFVSGWVYGIRAIILGM